MFDEQYLAAEIIRILSDYRPRFTQLVNEHVSFCYQRGMKKCEFFIDPASFIDGLWHVDVIQEHANVDEFDQFDWEQIFNVDRELLSEEQLKVFQQVAFEAGYKWLIEQLSIIYSDNKRVEITLLHNGSNFYEALEP